METLFDFPCSPTFRAYEAELLEQHYEAPPETERRQKLLDAMAADQAWMDSRRRNEYYEEPKPAPQNKQRNPGTSQTERKLRGIPL